MSGAQFLAGTEIWAVTGSLESPKIKVFLIRVISLLDKPFGLLILSLCC